MKNAVTLSTILSLGMFACAQPAPDDHPIDQALPTGEQVAMKLPDSDTIALGDLAEYYVVTRRTTRDLNGVTAWVLLLVHTIVQQPPTSVEGNVSTWGPGSGALDPADYRLVVTDREDGTYDWRLDGKSKTAADAEFLTVISGNAAPSDPIGRGHGEFAIDFDNAEAVNPIDNDVEGGVASFTYDLGRVDDRVVQVTIHGEGVDTDERPATFDYLYDELADGSGDFEFAVRADLDGETAALEDAAIRSRWQADGAGRGDATLSGGDLGELVVNVSECWDDRFARVYYADSLDIAPSEGEAADCAFAEALAP
jgi:hypothetical protein